MKYIFYLSGENNNIITRIHSNGFYGAICENELDKSIEEHKWKIKFLKLTKKDALVGISNSDFDFHNNNNYNTCGYYLHCQSSPPNLYSGPPFNYNGTKTNLNDVKDEIVLVMNMKKRTFKFLINNEDKGDSYTNIPVDKPLFPAVLLYYKDDSAEISEFQ